MNANDFQDEDARRKSDVSQLDRAIAVLGEHFDTVQIFCTRYEGASTVSVNKGTGNWHARAGQVREWVVKVEEEQRWDARRDCEE